MALKDSELVDLSKTLRGEDDDPLSDDALKLRPILRAVASLNGLAPERILSKERTQHVAFARHFAMYVAREITGLSFPIIGNFFQRDHSVVIYACTRIEQEMLTRPAFAAKMARFIHDVKPAREEIAA